LIERVLPKLNTLSALCALALFFFPWLDVRCSDKPMITQTGVQTVTGTYSPSSEFQKRSGDATQRRLDEEESRHSLLAGGALVATALAALVALAGLLSGGKGGVLPAGLLAGVALVLLVVQNSQGFPVEKDLHQARAESRGDAIAQALLADTIEVRRSPWIYATFGTLGFCTLLGLNAMIDRVKR
jgi:hypothetical protein